MDKLTIVIPYFNERAALTRLLASLPVDIPVIVVDDHSQTPPVVTRQNCEVVRPMRKGFFTGAVNAGISRCDTDVLVLNQDTTLEGDQWLSLLAQHRDKYALIGERIKGDHPAFPHGYVHGVFQFMRRDAINAAGLMDAETYPLWGASALWQWQIARKGFTSLPLPSIPGLWHEPRDPGQRYGRSINQLLAQDPGKQNLYIRTPPLLSVVIPCYNHGAYLADAVNSLIGGPTCLGDMPGQTFQSFEVVIVDDGSNPRNAEQIKALADGWKGIRVIRRPNGGTAAANNTGIKAAIGQYITILAADDMKEPWSLRDLYNAATAHPDQFVYDEPTLFRDGKRGVTFHLAAYDCAKLPRRNMVPAGILFPKQAWQAAGGYPEMMVHGREDWAFNIALARQGWYGHKVERSGYLYRREGQNRSLGNGDLREYFITQLAQVFPDVYRGDDMACCGGGKKSSMAKQNAPQMMLDAAMAPEGSVLLRYQGGNVGNETWGGPGTIPSGRYYVFGANAKDRVKFVDKRDVSWFLRHRENGKQIFVVQAATTPASAPNVQPHPEGTRRRLEPDKPQETIVFETPGGIGVAESGKQEQGETPVMVAEPTMIKPKAQPKRKHA